MNRAGKRHSQYPRCPFVVNVKGRDAEAVAFYKVMRYNMRVNWRKIDHLVGVAFERAFEDAVTTGIGYWRGRQAG